MNGQQNPCTTDREIAVKFDSVSFSYGDIKVLENASFHIHRGEFAALVGPNGSGKTTVLKLLLGLEQPSAGRIELFGYGGGEKSGGRDKAAAENKAIAGDTAAKNNSNAAAWRDRLGYVPQQPPADQSFPISVRDLVRMGLLRPSQGYAAGGNAAVEQALEQAGIKELADRSWRALSGGQRRRALVARALASRPEMLILDEPTANMDTESEERLFETLGKLKGSTTILIVTHDTDFVSAHIGRVLCLGDDVHQRYGIVQHRTDVASAGNSGHHTGVQEARVLHGENIPADECCDQGHRHE